MELKKGIDYIGVNVVFWCHDGNGNILFSKRSQKCKDEQGRWECGGGSMEFGESFDDAVTRELMEEYCTKPLKIDYVATQNMIRTHEGKKTHWMNNIHCALVDPKTVRIGEPDKIDEIGWFPIDALPTPLHSQIIHEVPVIKKFFSKK